jgi:hypothetical protein
MASVRSNLPEVVGAISRIATCFQLTRRRKSSKSLGEEALDVVRKNTLERSLEDHHGPTDAPWWAPNREWAKHDKRKIGKPVGVLGNSHNMLSAEALKGPILIQANQAEEVVGADEETRQKLEWFQDPFQGIDSAGRVRDQAPRKIVGFDEKTDKELEKLFDNQLDESIREVGG